MTTVKLEAKAEAIEEEVAQEGEGGEARNDGMAQAVNLVSPQASRVSAVESGAVASVDVPATPRKRSNSAVQTPRLISTYKAAKLSSADKAAKLKPADKAVCGIELKVVAEGIGERGEFVVLGAILPSHVLAEMQDDPFLRLSKKELKRMEVHSFKPPTGNLGKKQSCRQKDKIILSGGFGDSPATALHGLSVKQAFPLDSVHLG